MKKIITFFFITALSFSLIACGGGDHDIFISKYVENDYDNQAIEIYNSGKKSVNLSNYDIALYLNGNDYIEEPDRVIKLEGSLEAGKVHIVVNEFAETKLLEKADQLSKDLIFDGNDVVHLRYKAKKVIDLIHDLGDINDNFRDEIFVRRQGITKGNSKVEDLSHNNFDWDAYVPFYYDILGSHPVKHPEAPTFKEFPEIINPSQPLVHQLPGTLRMIEVLHINDGDTAGFTPVLTYKPAGEYLPGAFSGNQRIRYLGINTPELDHSYGNHDEYAVEATEYMEEMLNWANPTEAEIYLQFETDSQRDTYGRVLAYVWSDGLLTNYEQVLKGYSKVSGASKRDSKAYDANNIYLFRWLARAEEHARANKLGLYS